MQKQPEKEILEQIAELFKAFGDPTRVAILSLLVDGELCVNDITEAMTVSQSAISHQLRILKQMHLIIVILNCLSHSLMVMKTQNSVEKKSVKLSLENVEKHVNI